MAITTKKFNELYRQLNPQQKEAVDTIEGPVMVIAGPGTGKTQILTLRIANILRKTDIEPDNILALTFTESGAYAMRRRLTEIIGSPAYRVAISTFHGFCNRIIQNYPEYFSRIIGSNNITEVDQIKILEKVISSLPLERLRPYGDEFFYLRPVISAINELKREDIDEDELEKLIRKDEEYFAKIPDLYHESGPHAGKMKSKYRELEKETEKNRELAIIYHTYQEELRKNKLYDYNDMIMEVIKAFEESGDLLLSQQEQYQYILADEHQDANNAQNKVLDILSSFYASPNLFIVGDEKQAIFRFQGASLENFLYFKKRYPSSKIITLKKSYRSTQRILDSATSLIAKNIGKVSGRAMQLQSARPEGGKKISFFEFSSPSHERYYLARDIEEKIKSGVAPSEIALLYRDNKDAFPIADVFEKTSISFVIESDKDILADRDIKKLILLLRAVEAFGNDELLAESLHIDFLGIDPLDIYKVFQYSEESRIPLYDILRSVSTMKKIGLSSPLAFSAFYKNLSFWRVNSKNKGFIELFDEIVRDSGFLSYIVRKEDAIDKMEKLNGLFNEIKISAENHKDYSLRDFVDYLKMLEEHNVLIKKTAGGMRPSSVRLMTAHKAKGLEFDFVYIVDARDRHWGNRRIGRYFHLPLPTSSSANIMREIKNNDDERRLFYVAITRARKHVSISYSRESEEGRVEMPSLFVTEIDPELIEIKDAKSYEEDFEKKKDFLFSEKQVACRDIADKDYLREIFVRRGLSVTSLNNYLECPWRYFYVNLLRVPRAKTKHQMYGTAVHEALKLFFDKVKEGESVTKELLLDLFRSRLNKQPMPKRCFEVSLSRGLEALSGYFDIYHDDWIQTVINEFNIGAIQLTPEIKLTGKIDKVEILGSANEVNVVDYKTAKPKSRSDIEGRTKNSRGDYMRQLVFYNLLLAKYSSGKYRMISGEIDFVEPNDYGKYKKEKFVVDSKEVAELEELIRKVGDDIINLTFWGRRCFEKDCEFCGLRELME